MITRERERERDQVFIGKPNGISYRKSQSKPLIQSKSSMCDVMRKANDYQQ